MQNAALDRLEAEINKMDLDANTKAKLLAQARETMAKDKEQIDSLKEKLKDRVVKQRTITGAKYLSDGEKSSVEKALNDQQQTDRLNENQAIIDALRATQMVQRIIALFISISYLRFV